MYVCSLNLFSVCGDLQAAAEQTIPQLRGGNLVVNAISALDKLKGDMQLTLDLSQPVGTAVNEGIDPEQFRVVYTSTDEPIRLVHMVGGTEAQIFKTDIKNAFKLIPVRPARWRLLGFRWQGRTTFKCVTVLVGAEIGAFICRITSGGDNPTPTRNDHIGWDLRRVVGSRFVAVFSD